MGTAADDAELSDGRSGADEYRRRGWKRPERACRCRDLRKAGRRGDGAGSRRRHRRRHPQRRSHRARTAARLLLRDSPDGRRLEVPQQPGPGPLRPAVAVAGDRLRPPARRRNRRRAVSLGAGHRRRARGRRPSLAAIVRLAVGEIRHARRRHHGAAAALAGSSVDVGPVRRAHRVAGSTLPDCSAPRRRGHCSAALPRMPFGRCTTR